MQCCRFARICSRTGNCSSSRRSLTDKTFFDQVFVGYGTLVWPDEIDIGPEDVWEFAERHD